MNSSIVFQDSGCVIAVDHTLVENQTYFIKFPTGDSGSIRRAIELADLEDFVSWHEPNPIGTLKIVNRIGYLRFFDELFDVRSAKLLEGLSGERQFALLLDDLMKLSRDIRFDYSGPTGAGTAANYQAQDASPLERFANYKFLVVDARPPANLGAILKRIMRAPTTRLLDEYVEDYIWAAKRPTRRTVDSLLRNSRHFMQLDESHHLAGARLRGLRPRDRDSVFLSLRALMQRSSLSLDTPENRFVKHMLRDIEDVCFRVLADRGVPAKVHAVAKRMSSVVRTMLRDDFFRDIGRLGSVPSSSPALVGRRGYRELYSFYIQTRVGLHHLFDRFVLESMFVSLKDVADLYEYWVFYRVATGLFGTSAVMAARRSIIKNGKVRQAVILSAGNLTVEYNTTFSRVRGTSYSVGLRPDVIVRVRLQSSTIVILFDAKYRSKGEQGSVAADDEVDEELERKTKRFVTTEDLHKMHCYVDAIKDACCAMVVYPGTEFVFYPQDARIGVVNNSENVAELDGVGAIPLLPGSGVESAAFDNVMEKIVALASSCN
jgi:hypothetical protein